MKKFFLCFVSILLVIAIASSLWLYFYHNQKNPDNIPSKQLMVAYLQKKGEDYATEKLAGYTLEQITYVWDEPDGELFGMYGCIWEAEEADILVCFDSESCAKSVKLLPHE